MDEIIFAYTRAQAIEDGVLVDVSAMARKAGFVFPVAFTSTAWIQCVELPPGVACQDQQGRLWNVLQMLRNAVKRSTGLNEVRFSVLVKNDRHAPRLVDLKSDCRPGDHGEIVITVLLPNED